MRPNAPIILILVVPVALFLLGENSWGQQLLDLETLGVLEAANDEQNALARQATMTFRLIQRTFTDEKLSASQDFRGKCEWANDDMHLAGIRDDEEASSSGNSRRHEKIEVAIMGGKALASLGPLDSAGLPAKPPLLVIAPIEAMKHTGIESLFVPPFWLLTSPEIMYGTNLSKGLFRILRGEKISDEQRNAVSMNVDGHLVTVKCLYYNKTHATHLFDLDQGGRCIEMKCITANGVYEVFKRTWKQLPTGQWFPEQSLLRYSREGFDGAPHFECDFSISEIDFGGRPAVRPPLSLASFGPIPPGSSIQEFSGDGRAQRRNYLRVENADAQGQLDELARQVRGKGFVGGGEK